MNGNVHCSFCPGSQFFLLVLSGVQVGSISLPCLGTFHLHHALNQITFHLKGSYFVFRLFRTQISIDRTKLSYQPTPQPALHHNLANQSQSTLSHLLASLLYTSIISKLHFLKSATPKPPTQNSAVLWLNLAIDEAQPKDQSQIIPMRTRKLGEPSPHTISAWRTSP